MWPTLHYDANRCSSIYEKKSHKQKEAEEGTTTTTTTTTTSITTTKKHTQKERKTLFNVITLFGAVNYKKKK